MSGRAWSRRGSAVALLFASLTSALAVALGTTRALADDADAGGAPTPRARAWAKRSITIGFFDDFLGLPNSRLRDDNGFVANQRITVEVPDGDSGLLRVGLSEQLITERGGLDRVDDGKVYATWKRFLGPSPARGLTISWTLGLQVVGNLGGAIMQDWAHHTVFSGRHLEEQGVHQLQYRYPRWYDVLGDFGGLAMIVHPLGGPWSVRGGVEGALGLGTGYFGELHPFFAITSATEFVEIEFREGAGIYGTNVRPLTMRGGYVTGVLQSQPSMHVTVPGPHWLPTTLTFDLEWNQGDSHQHVGGLTVGARF
jgi:hypothetical protein